MSKEYNTIYIGYLLGYHYSDPIILCVSDERYKVKSYLRDVRKLGKRQCEIRKVILDSQSAYSLYGDYWLEEFNEDVLYLTNRDLEFITKEVEGTIRSMEGTYENVKQYRDLIADVPQLKESLTMFDMTIKTMERQLSKVKTLRRIGNSVIKKSVVLSPNIMEYLQHMDLLQEDRELTELFYRKVNEDD